MTPPELLHAIRHLSTAALRIERGELHFALADLTEARADINYALRTVRAELAAAEAGAPE